MNAPLDEREFSIDNRSVQCPRFVTLLGASFTSNSVRLCESTVRRGLRLLSFSERTEASNHVQMSEQRQHFLFSYLKTLNVGAAGNRTRVYRSTVS